MLPTSTQKHIVHNHVQIQSILLAEGSIQDNKNEKINHSPACVPAFEFCPAIPVKPGEGVGVGPGVEVEGPYQGQGPGPWHLGER